MGKNISAALCLVILSACMPPEDGPGLLGVVLVAEGFQDPVYVTSDPADAQRLFVVEQRRGVVRIVLDGAVLDTPFLDIANKVESSGTEQGLYCIAFHPNYQENGYFYVSYAALDDATTVERYTVTSDPNVADPGSAKIILEIEEPFSSHNGGTIAFGPHDGYMYLSLGDGGFIINTPLENAQDLSNPLGAILRIDVDGGDPFAIPDSNPFVGVAGADEKIWSYGLRNPWRFSFDRLTGDLYIGDVGQFSREEIDFQPFDSPGGENYGWPVAEGFACLGGVGDCGLDPAFTPPIHDYGGFGGKSVSGGYVYRGGAIPWLQGAYFFADFVSSRVWSFRVDEGQLDDFVEHTMDLEPPDGGFGGIPSFGEDADGELYIVGYAAGRIYKIIDRPEDAAGDPESQTAAAHAR